MGSQQLTFDGDLELIDVGGGDPEGFTIEAVAGTQFGNPVPVEAVVASFLRDGSIVSKTGDENREMSVLVRISGPDGVALALGEKRLNLATGKRTTLAWTPPDGLGPTTVFEVLTSSLERVEDDWDLDEVRGVRTYRLRLVCLPFGRSVDLIIDDADTPPADPGTVVNACESTTGWSSTDAGSGSPFGSPAAPAVDSVVFHGGTGSVRCEAWQWSAGAVDSAGDLVAFGRNMDTLTGLSIDTGSGGFLSVWIKLDWPEGAGLDRRSEVEEIVMWTVGGPSGGTLVDFVAAEAAADGFVRHVWAVDAGVEVTQLKFTSVQWRYGYQPTPRAGVRYDEISLATTATTDSQISKTFDVGGSARGPGSLHVAAGDDADPLGYVLLMTVADSEVAPGFQPDGRRWVTSGTTTVDATALHGSYFDASDTVFDVPVAMLSTGAYTIVALARAPSDLTIGLTAQLVAGGSATGPVSAAAVTVPSEGDVWRFVTIGTVYLPPLPMMNADGDDVVRVEFTGGAKLADWFMVPASADFTVVDCGDGVVSAAGASSHLWLDSPSPSQPRGGWWRGPEAERVSAKSAWPDVKKPGRHVFAPGRVNAYLVTTEAQGPRLTLERFNHWFGNAGT